MSLSSSSAVPLYLQLKQRIQEEIQQGKYKVDEQLPPEPELCDMYSVSRITVRRALSDLVKEGCLIRKQGKGTFVAGTKVHNELISVSGFSEFSLELGKTPKSKILLCETVRADSVLAKALSVEESSPVVRLHRLLYLEDDPLFLDDAYYSLTRFPELDRYITNVSSTYKVLKEHYNTESVSSEKEINVVMAGTTEADLLQCSLGTTLYRIDKIAYDKFNQPIHTSRFFCPTNRVTLTIGRDFVRKALT